MHTLTPYLARLEQRLVPSTITVTTLADAGAGSLRAALATADTLPGKDTIKFHLPPPPVNSENIITLTSGVLASKGNVTITGPVAGKLIVNGNAASGVFAFNDGSTTTDSPATISGLSIVNGKTPGNGGGVYSTESLTLRNTVISGNHATASGGGVWVSGDLGARSLGISGSLISNNSANSYSGVDVFRVQSISIVKSTLSGNTATNSAGGAYLSINSTGTRLSVTGSSITGNTGSSGGGLFVKDFASSPKVKATISGCTISNNISTSTGGTRGGGGLFLNTGNFSVSNCTISNNSAVYLGGGIQVNGFASLTISKSTISGNRTTATNASNQGGGGVLIEDTGSATLKPATIKGCTINDNISSQYGGGVLAMNGVKLSISGSKFSSNRASDEGGGLLALGAGANKVDLAISGTTFANNFAVLAGGGMQATGDGQISITASKFLGNASEYGGAMRAISTVATNGLVIKNTTVSGNIASAYGGGLQIESTPDFHITGGSITNNSAGAGGGGVHPYNSSGSISGVTISGNFAEQSGGGIFHGGTGTVSVQAKKVKANSAPFNPDFDGAFTFI